MSDSKVVSVRVRKRLAEMFVRACDDAGVEPSVVLRALLEQVVRDRSAPVLVPRKEADRD